MEKSLSTAEGKKGEKKRTQREEGKPQQLLLLVLSIVSLKLMCWSSLLRPSHSLLSGTFWQQCLLMSYLRRTSSGADSSLADHLGKCYMKELGKHSHKHLHLQAGNSYRGAGSLLVICSLRHLRNLGFEFRIFQPFSLLHLLLQRKLLLAWLALR